MHPEIEQQGPGICPKCGMALEPRTVVPEEENLELVDMTRRFRASTVLAVPVFLLAMIADLAAQWLPQGLSLRTVQWIEFTLATPVVLWGGWPFFIRGWQSVKTWNLNMFPLIGLGVSVAWTYTVVALLFPHTFPPSYFVPVVVLVAITTFVVWGLIGPEPRLAQAIVNAVAVLIIACPRALGLATPISIMVGTIYHGWHRPGCDGRCPDKER